MRSDAEKVAAEMPPSIDLTVEAVEDLKGTGLLVLDVREVASFTDYLVMCTGSSDRHVQAIVDGIKEKLRGADVTPLHTEGYEQATWVLVDFVDFLVNVFTPETREFYQLERVWRDAPVLVGEREELAADSGADGDTTAAEPDAANAAPAGAEPAGDAEGAAGDAADD